MDSLSFNAENAALVHNYIDPVSLLPTMIGLGVTMSLLTTLMVVMRLYANFRLVRRVVWDDCFAVTGIIFTWAYTGLAISMGNTARHSEDVPASAINDLFNKRLYSLGMVFGPGIFSAKAMLLTLYLRIFAPSKWLRISVYCGLGFAFGIYMMDVPLFSIYCAPQSGEGWGIHLEKRCLPKRVLFCFIQGIFSLGSNVFILALPIPVIYKLNLPTRRKLELLSVFVSGIWACIASTLAMYYRYLNFQSKDPSWNAANGEICAMVEQCVTIMCGCVPVIAVYFRKYPLAEFSVWKQKLRSSLRFQKVPNALKSLTATFSSGGTTMKGSSTSQVSQPRLTAPARTDLESNVAEEDRHEYYELDDEQRKHVFVSTRTPGSPVSTIQEERFSYGLGSSVSSSLPVLGRGGVLTLEDDYCPHHGL